MRQPATILDHPAISGRYLFPQTRTFRDPLMVEVPGATLACYHRIIDPANYTLLHFHGNGEAVADYLPEMADELAKLGLNSLFVEYRQYGESTGKAQLAAMLGDGAAVLAATGLAPEKVIAFGRSIGSLYAIELVHRQPKIAGLVLESGIADPSERFLLYADLTGTNFTEAEVYAAAQQLFDHKQKLSGYTNPVLILHTLHDNLVDITHADRNYEWAASPKKQLVKFPFGDHNSIMGRNQTAYFEALRDFAKQMTQP